METRTVEVVIPADPANLDSEAKVRGLGTWDYCSCWLHQQRAGPGWSHAGAWGESLALGSHFSSTVSEGCINAPHGVSSSLEGDRSLGILPAFCLHPCHCF